MLCKKNDKTKDSEKDYGKLWNGIILPSQHNWRPGQSLPFFAPPLDCSIGLDHFESRVAEELEIPNFEEAAERSDATVLGKVSTNGEKFELVVVLSKPISL